MRHKTRQTLCAAMLLLAGISGSTPAATPKLWQLQRVGEPTQEYPDVHAVAISPDGKRVAAAGTGLRLWDAATGDPVGKPLLKHQQGIQSVAWSPDGRFVATGGYDGLLVLWDANAHELLWEAPTRHGYVTAIAFSPDGTRLATGGNKDGSIRLWERASGRELGAPLSGHAREVRALVFADDQTLVSASLDGAIHVWDIQARRIQRTIQTGMAHGPQRLALNPRQPLVAASDNDSIAFWNIRTGAVAAGTLKGYGATYGLWGLAFTADGERLMSADSGGGVALIDWRKGEAVARGTALHRAAIVWQTAFSARGDLVATAGKDGVLGIWRTSVASGEAPFAVREVGQTPHPYGDAQVAVSDDGRYAAYGYKRLAIVERASGRMLVDDQTVGHVGIMRFSPDSQYFAFIDGEQRVVVFHLPTRQRVASERGFAQVDQAGAFSPDGRRLALGIHEGRGYSVVVVDTRSAVPVGRYRFPVGRGNPRILSISYSGDGKTLLAASLENDVYRLHADTLQPAGGAWPGAGYLAVYSPDGRRVAVARPGDHNSHDVVVLDAASGAPLTNPMSAHAEMIRALAFTPDGRYLLSASIDGPLILWDSETGARIGQERVSRSYSLRGYQITRDARRLYTQSGAGNAQSPFLLHEWAIAINAARAPGIANALPSGPGAATPKSEVVSRVEGFEVTAAAFAPHSGEVVIGSWSTLRFLKENTLRETGDYFHTDDPRPQPAIVNSVAVSRDGRRASAGPDGAPMHIYDVATGRRVSVVEDFGYGAHAFVADGRLAVAAEGGFRLIDPERGATLSRHRFPIEGYVTALAAANRSTWVALGTDQGHLLLASSDGKTLPISIERAHRGSITEIAFSPDDRLVASGGNDGKVRILDTLTAREAGEPWRAHDRAVTAIAFSGDGQLVASGASDGTFRIWSLRTGAPLTNALAVHTGPLLAILPEKNGSWLTFGRDGILRRWSMASEGRVQAPAAAPVR